MQHVNFLAYLVASCPRIVYLCTLCRFFGNFALCFACNCSAVVVAFFRVIHMDKINQLRDLEAVLASLKEKREKFLQCKDYRVAHALDETAQKLDQYIKKGQLRHAGKH